MVVWILCRLDMSVVDKHIPLNRMAAQQSVVLLKNQKRLLPLQMGSYKSVALIGPCVDDSTCPRGTCVCMCRCICMCVYACISVCVCVCVWIPQVVKKGCSWRGFYMWVVNFPLPIGDYDPEPKYIVTVKQAFANRTRLSVRLETLHGMKRVLWSTLSAVFSLGR